MPVPGPAPHRAGVRHPVQHHGGRLAAHLHRTARPPSLRRSGRWAAPAARPPVRRPPAAPGAHRDARRSGGHHQPRRRPAQHQAPRRSSTPRAARAPPPRPTSTPPLSSRISGTGCGRRVQRPGQRRGRPVGSPQAAVAAVRCGGQVGHLDVAAARCAAAAPGPRPGRRRCRRRAAGAGRARRAPGRGRGGRAGPAARPTGTSGCSAGPPGAGPGRPAASLGVRAAQQQQLRIDPAHPDRLPSRARLMRLAALRLMTVRTGVSHAGDRADRRPVG